MRTDLQNRAMFVSFCIEQYAKAHNILAPEAEEILHSYGITEHFCEFYEPLHSQSQQWLVQEMDIMINKRKN